jgi:hypothetical protein
MRNPNPRWFDGMPKWQPFLICFVCFFAVTALIKWIT